jgi:hypothetical protein
MNLSEFPDLARLPKRKRMQLADELWLSCVDDRSKTAKWHRDTLEERWSDYRSGTAKRISLKELERRLEKR